MARTTVLILALVGLSYTGNALAQQDAGDDEIAALMNMTIDQLVAQAQHQSDAGRVGEAYATLDLAIRRDPKHAGAWLALGRILTERALPAQAVAALETASSLDPALTGLNHQLGKAYAQNGSHRKAVKAYRRQRKLAGQTPELAFDLGMAHLQLDQRDEAQEAFQSAADATSDLTGRAHYNLALIAMQRGDRDAALNAMQRAVDTDTNAQRKASFAAQLAAMRDSDQPVQQRAEQIIDMRAELTRATDAQLRRITGRGDDRLITGSFTLAIEYDDNVSLVDNDLLLPANVNDQEDARLVAKLFLEAQPWRQGRWLAGARFSGYHSAHFGEEEVDYGVAAIDPYLRWTGDDWLFEFDAALSYAQLGGNDYESHITPGIAAVWRQCDHAAVRLYYRYTHRNSFLPAAINPATDRDGNIHYLGAVQSFWNEDRSVQVYVGLAGELQRTQGSDFDRDAITLLLGVAFDFAFQTRANVTYRFLHENYLNPNTASGTGSKRDDDRHSFTVRLTRALCENVDVYGEYRYMHNDSNIDGFDFESNIVALGLIYSF